MVQPSRERRPPRTGRLPRRCTDRLEDAAAWALSAGALLVLLVAVLGGIGVHRDAIDRGRAAAQERSQLAAVLLTDVLTPYGGPSVPTLRLARYRDAAGVDHDVVVTTAGRPPAGTVVPVWVTRDGRMVDSPPDALDALVLGVCAAGAVATSGWAVLLVLGWGARRWLEGRNAAAWAREWVAVEPVWTGRDR